LACGIINYLLRIAETFSKARTVHQVAIGHGPYSFRLKALVIGDQQGENRVEKSSGIRVEEPVRVLHTLNELVPRTLVEVYFHRVVFAIKVRSVAGVI